MHSLGRLALCAVGVTFGRAGFLQAPQEWTGTENGGSFIVQHLAPARAPKGQRQTSLADHVAKVMAAQPPVGRDTLIQTSEKIEAQVLWVHGMDENVDATWAKKFDAEKEK